MLIPKASFRKNLSSKWLSMDKGDESSTGTSILNRMAATSVSNGATAFFSSAANRWSRATSSRLWNSQRLVSASTRSVVLRSSRIKTEMTSPGWLAPSQPYPSLSSCPSLIIRAYLSGDWRNRASSKLAKRSQRRFRARLLASLIRGY